MSSAAPWVRWIMVVAGLLAGSTCESLAREPLSFPDAWLEPIPWSALEGWASDDHAAAFAAFAASCRPILRDPKWAQDARPMASALRDVCRRARALSFPDPARSGAFFEDNFRPVEVAKLGDRAGFLTGYYEPIVDGSRVPTPVFHTPLYRRPEDLVVLGGQPAGQEFPNRAQVGRRVDDHVVVPYFDRGQIEDGALDGRHLEICWIKDPLEAMIIQIEGSARIRLEDGSILRVNYAAHNGLPYTAIGRVLIQRNQVPKEEMSLDRIRKWVAEHSDEAADLRRTNRSYVFFRISGLDSDEPPVGGQGVKLTPGRSIAVDSALHVYGTPFFIVADLPSATGNTTVSFRRLMIAQDTGSAIVGPARADLFFGAGDDAGRAAGRVRQAGRFAMLIPREIDPVDAGARMPEPQPRPDFEAMAASEAALAKSTTQIRPGAPVRIGRPVNAVAHVPEPQPRPDFETEAKAAAEAAPAKPIVQTRPGAPRRMVRHVAGRPERRRLHRQYLQYWGAWRYQGVWR
jgi:membrane-bound lytic murein transglycosylase A